MSDKKLNTIPLFVYGELKRGGWLHDAYLEEATFCGTGHCTRDWVLFDMGYFPAAVNPAVLSTEQRQNLIPRSKRQRIQGELWYVDSLKGTDLAEGYPTFYDRANVWIALDKGGGQSAWMYYLVDPPGTLPVIESGVWVINRRSVSRQ